LNDPVQQLVDPADAFEGLDGIQCFEPFTCFCGIAVLVHGITSKDIVATYFASSRSALPPIVKWTGAPSSFSEIAASFGQRYREIIKVRLVRHAKPE
jgi:hypothetical protein